MRSSLRRSGRFLRRIGSARTVSTLIGVELPGLARAYREGEVSWVKAGAVARVADESSEQYWIRMARSVTFPRLREETAAVAARIETDPPQGRRRLRFG